jgi:hypothetical protein
MGYRGINMTDTYSEHQFRAIVREETADMRSDITGLKADMIAMRSELSRFGMVQKQMQSDIGILKEGVRHLGVLYEDMHGDIKIILEVLHGNAEVRQAVLEHGSRLTVLEKEHLLLKSTVARHSRQLKQRHA